MGNKEGGGEGAGEKRGKEQQNGEGRVVGTSRSCGPVLRRHTSPRERVVPTVRFTRETLRGIESTHATGIHS